MQLRTVLTAPVVLAAALGLVGVAPVAVAAPARTAAPAIAPAAADPVEVFCEEPLLPAARPAWKLARNNPTKLAQVARTTGRSVGRMAEMAQDRSVWLDTCGVQFYVDDSAGHDDAPPEPTVARADVPADVLDLSSRPGAARTIYLDFDGETVRDTLWNRELGQSAITMAPFSITAPATTDFTAEERQAIYEAWTVVAEDFAPFDVNVTTRDPGVEAMHRSSPSDEVYGTRALIASRGLLDTLCQGCGGIAVLDVFDRVGRDHDFTQPALVFPGALSHRGAWIGEVASHEVGHNFGLSHDGNRFSEYYDGHGSWGPVMGSAFSRPLSQWSRGEYAGASMVEDDLALISRHAPFRLDDHGDVSAPTELSAGVPAYGVVERASDQDAFSFTAAGGVRLHAAPTSPFPNLDLELAVYDESGAKVASVNPPITISRGVARGYDALWQVTLPDTPARYTAVIDGVGHGDPATTGYSDYGSLGAYVVRLDSATAVDPTDPVPPVAEQPVNPPDGSIIGGGLVTTPVARALRLPVAKRLTALAGYRYKVKFTAVGGTGDYRWRVKGKLPRGLRTGARDDGRSFTIVGKPRKPQRTRITLVVRDEGGQKVTGSYKLRIRR